jgi:hypothetical protein
MLLLDPSVALGIALATITNNLAFGVIRLALMPPFETNL